MACLAYAVSSRLRGSGRRCIGYLDLPLYPSLPATDEQRPLNRCAASGETTAAEETRNAFCWTGFGRSARDHDTDGRARGGGGIEYAASCCLARVKCRAGVGWRRIGRALGNNWRPPRDRPRPAMERRAGACSLGATSSIRTAGLLWLAGADLLGLGSWERSLRLSFRRLARPDRRVGQSVAVDGCNRCFARASCACPARRPGQRATTL
jgi:hypothetical protein